MWKLRTLNDAYQKREPTRYIVDKFFAAGTLNIVYGAPASYKSMVLADMCGAVVSGNDWLPGSLGKGGEGVAVEKSAIMWVDMDNGTRRTDERFDAIGTARQLPADAPLHYVSMPTPPLQLHSNYHYKEGETEYNIIDLLLGLIGLIRQVNAQIVVIDNLGLITGDVEENGAGMASIMSHLRMIAERTDCALIIIHHQRKGGANGGRAGEALRGHSSIEAAVDLALQVVRESDTAEVTLQSTKTRGVDVPTIRARFNYTHRDGTNDLGSAWFDGIAGVRGENAVRNAIEEVLANGAMTKTKLAQDVSSMLDGTGINRVRAWIDEMLAAGDLEEVKAKGNKRVIKLQN